MIKILKGVTLFTLAFLANVVPSFANSNNSLTIDQNLRQPELAFINDYPAHSQNGDWVQGWYNGVFGRWWVENGVVVPQGNIYVKPPRYSTGLPIVVAPPSARISYYCPAPTGYYPMVQQCLGPWRITLQN